jgi:hypothetical protein
LLGTSTTGANETSEPIATITLNQWKGFEWIVGKAKYDVYADGAVRIIGNSLFTASDFFVDIRQPIQIVYSAEESGDAFGQYFVREDVDTNPGPGVSLIRTSAFISGSVFGWTTYNVIDGLETQLRPRSTVRRQASYFHAPTNTFISLKDSALTGVVWSDSTPASVNFAAMAYFRATRDGTKPPEELATDLQAILNGVTREFSEGISDELFVLTMRFGRQNLYIM